jgi:nucleotide-binding universal stress UspA family protein
LQPVALKSLVVEGDPAEAITREAAERGVDLIVMRSRRRPYAAAVLGSTAEAVCRTAPCPVIVTHPSEREWEGFASGEIKLQRILAAYDFSDLSELALNYSLSLAQEYQAELHLLHVLPSRVKPDGADFAWRQGGAEDEFQQAVRRLQNAVPSEAMLWCHVNQALREGKPYREILAYAEEQDVDLICLGASGKDFGLRALFGSNVDRVLRQAPCPILIARPLRPAQTIAPRHSEPSAPHPAPEKK